MRNLKRALSLALAMVMVLSMTVIGASAVSVDDFSDSADIVNKEAVMVLATLGVITGNDDGSYAPADTISRAEMSTIICRVLNGGKDPVLGEAVTNTYTDTVNHWAKNYIEYCSTLGIVSGKGDGTYDPEGEVTVSEAAKMVLVALGYNAAMEGYTGGAWQINVDARANPIGLYDDLDYTTTSAPLTRDNAAQMLYNALDCDMMKYDVVLDTTSSTVISTTQLGKTGDTLLEGKFDAVKVEGVVVANEMATLSGAGHLVDGRTRILVTNYADQEYYGGRKGANGVNYFVETEDFTVTTGLDELGRSVSMYVKKNPTSTNAQVLGSVIVSENNVVVANYSKDTLAKIADDNGLQLLGATQAGHNYYDDGTLIATNYGGLDELSDAAAEATNIRGQEKILIDNDNDGDVEYVLVNSWRFGKVTSYVSNGDGSIVINQGSAATLSKSNAKDVVGFEDVAKDDYVIAAEIAGRIHVSVAESITGTLDAYNTGSTALEEGDDRDSSSVVVKVTVDGEDKNTSSMLGYTGGSDDIKAANEYGETYLDNEAVFYLGAGGFVVAVGETDASAYRYALVLETGTNSLEDRVRVALADGTISVYDIDEDSDVDEKTAEVGTVYRYSINSNDEIRLVKIPDEETVALADAEFEKGRTSIKDNGTTEGNATESTVFFYVGADDIHNADEIDRHVVDVYNGYKTAPDLEDNNNIKGDIYIRSIPNSSTKSAGAVVFYGDDSLTAPDMDDSLYVTEIVRRSTNFVLVNAFVAGHEGAEEEIEVDINSEDVLKAKTAYTFEVNSDGRYELTTLDRVTPELGVDGNDKVVTSSNSDVFVLTGNKEYGITSDTLFVDHSDYLDDPVGQLGEGPDAGDNVTWVTYNGDGDAVLVVIQNEEVGLTNVPTIAYDPQLVDADGKAVTGDALKESTTLYWNDVDKNDELKLAVTGLTDAQSVKIAVTKDTKATGKVEDITNPDKGDDFASDAIYTANGALENGGKITVTITTKEDEMGDRTVTHTIYVSAPKAAAPDVDLKHTGTGTFAYADGATEPVAGGTVKATVTGIGSDFKVNFDVANAANTRIGEMTLKVNDGAAESYLNKTEKDVTAGTTTYVLTVPVTEAGKLDATYVYTVKIEAEQDQSTPAVVQLTDGSANELTVTGGPVALTKDGAEATASTYADGTADTLGFKLESSVAGTVTATISVNGGATETFTLNTDGTTVTDVTVPEAGEYTYELTVTTEETGKAPVTETVSVTVTVE